MIELYKFWTVSTNWYYTNNKEDISYSGDTYTAIPINRSELNFEFDKSAASITMPYNYEPASLFRVLNPTNVLWVSIRDYSSSNIIFVGKVTSCEMDIPKALSILKTMSVQSVTISQIPARTYSTICTNNLFDNKCTIAKANFLVTAPMSEVIISGNTVQHNNFSFKPDGWFNRGYIVVGVESSFILDHVSDTLTLLYPLQTTTGTLNAYAGCDKKIATCQSKFSNEINFGGTPFVPLTNIFIDGW